MRRVIGNMSYRKGVSPEVQALFEVSMNLLHRLSSGGKITQKEFELMWATYANLQMFWEQALSTEDAPPSDKLN